MQSTLPPERRTLDHSDVPIGPARPPTTGQRRIIGGVAAGLAALTATACLPPLPGAPGRTGAAAPAGTWRHQAESWIQDTGTRLAGRSVQAVDWGNKVVHASAPGSVALAVATSPAGSRDALADAGSRQGTTPSATTLDDAVAQLRAGRVSFVQLRARWLGASSLGSDGSNAGWVSAAFTTTIGQPPTTAERAGLVAALAHNSRATVATVLLADDRAAQRTISAIGADLDVAAPVDLPGWVKHHLVKAGRDERVVRAELATARIAPPAPVAIGVGMTGSSVEWEIIYRAPLQRIGPVQKGRPTAVASAAQIGCGVLSALGYQRPRAGGGWETPVGGACTGQPGRERAMAEALPHGSLVLFGIGAWEDRDTRSPNGTVLRYGSTAMRATVVKELVRRTDDMRARGVRVAIPDWPCPGAATTGTRRESASHAQWVHSIAAAVQAARPEVRIIPMSSAMCAQPGPAVPHRALDARRHGAEHFPDQEASAYYFRYVIAGALADTPLPR